ncbi:MAG: hypothetical protein JWN38_215 [Candidatus Saccharibacteria bacterium]|nr:hypothetical protein [Candidatus Saccharibacteria bacterium]
MSTAASPDQTPALALITTDTLRHFEARPPDLDYTERRLLHENDELMLWLRRVATKNFPDLEQRERAMEMSLGVIALMMRQRDVNALDTLYGLAEAIPEAS